ncbi:MAG: hypothetical protein WB869_07105 [Candidatus Acidiferrales bacterium]
MKEDELDHILSNQQEIVPSQGFVSAVMDAVRCEAAASSPIPFPWKRALPGLSATGFTLLWVFVAGTALLKRETAGQPIPTSLLSALALILEGWKTVGASWIALALVLSLASVKLSMRYASHKR